MIIQEFIHKQISTNSDIMEIEKSGNITVLAIIDNSGKHTKMQFYDSELKELVNILNEFVNQRTLSKTIGKD